MNEPKKQLVQQMHQLAEDIEKYDRPEKLWEQREGSRWVPCTHIPNLMSLSAFRRIEPVTEALINGKLTKLGVAAMPYGTEYVYVPHVTATEQHTSHEFGAFLAYKKDYIDHMLKHRLIYLNAADAVARANAMLQFEYPN